MIKNRQSCEAIAYLWHSSPCHLSDLGSSSKKVLKSQRKHRFASNSITKCVQQHTVSTLKPLEALKTLSAGFFVRQSIPPSLCFGLLFVWGFFSPEKDYFQHWQSRQLWPLANHGIMRQPVYSSHSAFHELPVCIGPEVSHPFCYNKNERTPPHILCYLISKSLSLKNHTLWIEPSQTTECNGECHRWECFYQPL